MGPSGGASSLAAQLYDPLDLGWRKGVSGGKNTGWGPWQAPGEKELVWLCGQGTGRKGIGICVKEV